MGNVFFFDWEVRLIALIQTVGNGFLTTLATLFTLLGEEYLVILVLGLLYWCFDKELGRRAALALSGTMLFGTLIKGLALRRRPYMDNEEVECLRAAHPDGDIMSPIEQGYSMPSLHSSMSVSVYGTIAYERKKKWLIVLGVMLPLLIGASRIYLGVHYPTDVFSGWLLGLILVFVLNAVEHRFGYKFGFAAVLIAGAAGFFFCRDNEFYSAWGTVLGLLLGFAHEEKHIGFERPWKWWCYIVRPVLGVAIFAAVSAVLKLPAKAISSEWLSLVYRLIRYALSTFVIIGLYPRLFKKIGI